MAATGRAAGRNSWVGEGVDPASAEGRAGTRGASENEASDVVSDAASSSGGEAGATLTTADMNTLSASRLRELLAQREEELRVAAELGQMLLDRANVAEEALDEECERSYALITELEAVKERHELALHRRAQAQEELLEKELQCKQAEEEAARWRRAAAEAQEEASALRRSLFSERDRSRKLAGKATSASMRLRAAERLEGELASKQGGSLPPRLSGPPEPRSAHEEEGAQSPAADGERTPKRRAGRRMSSLVRLVRGRRSNEAGDAGAASHSAPHGEPAASEAAERAAMAAEECLLWRVAAREASRMLSLVEAANAALEAQGEEREVLLESLQSSLSEREAEAAQETEARELALTDWRPEQAPVHSGQGGQSTAPALEDRGSAQREMEGEERAKVRRQSSRAQLARVREALRAGRRSSVALSTPHGVSRDRSMSAAAPLSPPQAETRRGAPVRRRRARLSRAETEFRVQLQEHTRRRSGLTSTYQGASGGRRSSRVISAGPSPRHRPSLGLGNAASAAPASRARPPLPPMVDLSGDAASVLDTADRGGGEGGRRESVVDESQWRDAIATLAGDAAAGALGPVAEPRTPATAAQELGTVCKALLTAATAAAERAGGESRQQLMRHPSAAMLRRPSLPRETAGKAVTVEGTSTEGAEGSVQRSGAAQGQERPVRRAAQSASAGTGRASGVGRHAPADEDEEKEDQAKATQPRPADLFLPTRGSVDVRQRRLHRFLVDAHRSLERRRHLILVTAACLCSGQPPLRAPWVPDPAARACSHCATPFAAFLRRHHCRACGGLFCDKRVNFSLIGAPTGDAARGRRVRVCDECFAVLSLAQRGRGSLASVRGAGRRHSLGPRPPGQV